MSIFLKKNSYTKYIISLCMLLFTYIFFIVLFNIYIDTFGIISGTKKISGQDHQRLVKAAAVRHVKPKGLILGSSRAGHGLDPKHLSGDGYPVYNLSLGGASMYEIMRYFQHANAIQPLEKVMLALDFQSFRIKPKPYASTFSEERLAANAMGVRNIFPPWQDYLKILLSLDGMKKSIEVLKNNNIKSKLDILPNGLHKYSEKILKSNNKKKRLIFKRKLKSYRKSYSNFNFDEGNENNTPFDFLRRILKVAYEQDIDLNIIISPTHAFISELQAQTGLWNLRENWKRKLVQINEEEALYSSRKPFYLWDFSGYNKYTTEAVPLERDKKTIMKWYTDPSHYTIGLGDIMFNIIKAGNTSAGEFGAQLSSKNIDMHLVNIREKRKQWREVNQNEISKILR